MFSNEIYMKLFSLMVLEKFGDILIEHDGSIYIYWVPNDNK